jgi:ubiquitin carboxyl-terminal hydrolase 4/11/15
LFFLTNHHLYDVNIENPLGNGGRLASAYETSIKDMYFTSQKSISPSNLKRAIATYAPRFAGCQQHDAQEFLAYLLDGLHEDLNRVCYKTQKKKYVEMPDIDGKKINSWDMQIKGAEVWDIYRLRNDSLVMDTFYGQFKSTCVCPLCERVSVAFDSYNHISLEIPQNPSSLKRTIPIIVYRPFSSNDSNDFPALMRYAVKVDQNNSNLSNSASFVSDIKYQLEKLTGIHTTRMMLCDVYENAIFDILK